MFQSKVIKVESKTYELFLEMCKIQECSPELNLHLILAEVVWKFIEEVNVKPLPVHSRLLRLQESRYDD